MRAHQLILFPQLGIIEIVLEKCLLIFRAHNLQRVGDHRLVVVDIDKIWLAFAFLWVHYFLIHYSINN